MTALDHKFLPFKKTPITLASVAVAVWGFLFVAMCVRTLTTRNEGHSVYPVFARAAQNWLSGEPLYVRGGTEEFRYSPLIAALFVPFDLLSHRVGEVLWRSLNFWTFLGGLYYCCEVAIPRRLLRTEIAAVFLLIIPLSIGSLNNAQSNPLVLGLMLVSAAACVQRRWTLAAITITLATCFKLYPVSLGLLLLLYFPWRLGWRLAVCVTAAAVLPFVMQRAAYVMDQYAVWAHYLSTEDRQRGPITDWYRDLRGVWRVYVMPMSMRTYLVVEVAVAAGMAALCLLGRIRRWPVERLVYFAFCFACCWMTVLGPATESATYIMLAPVVAWTLVTKADSQADRYWRVGYAVVFGIFFLSQLALNIPGGKFFRDQLQPLTVAGLILTLMLTVEMIYPLVKTDRSRDARSIVPVP